MILSGKEMQLLEGMIGKKAERILVPLPADSAAKPVEIVVVFSRDSGLLIDSCYRAQKPIETPAHYPQLRVRLIQDIPNYINGSSIDLSSRDSGLLIDSCYRAQKPIETPAHYPQLRVRLIQDIPNYINGSSIDLSEEGEIVRAIEVISEDVQTSEDTASYTKSIRIEFTGAREVTISRETFRSPCLAVYEKEPLRLRDGETTARITSHIQRL